MDSLLERIEENKLDALYLFINETLRDPNEFERFFASLLSVLPENYSIQRVEVGHEFLTMCQRQEELFRVVCNVESLRTLIISDGYVPRKDNGGLNADALLESLPRARNLINLDLMRLVVTGSQVKLLAEVLESMHESLEDIRLTGLTNVDGVSLDEPIQACVDMSNLRSLAISSRQPSIPRTTAAAAAAAAHNNNAQENSNNNIDEEDASQVSSSSSISTKKLPPQWITKERLLQLCQNSTTLQDLSLRSMNLNDDACQTIATALKTNSFLTSLDIRQNEHITDKGYSAILEALERNYDLWCTVMVVSTFGAERERERVKFDWKTIRPIFDLPSHLFAFELQDNDSFQAKFNSLIELNQANRGDLLRNPTREKLATFIETLSVDPTGKLHIRV